jgi:putative transposase
MGRSMLLPYEGKTSVRNRANRQRIPSVNVRASKESHCEDSCREILSRAKTPQGLNVIQVTCYMTSWSLDHTHWLKSRDRFLLPIHVLRRVFRGKFVAALRQAFHDHQLVFHGNLTLLAQPRTFAAWLRPLFRKDWVVYSKPPFGGPEYVLQYLGRYTHRVAISNHRLASFAEGKVTFRWRDSAHHNEQKLLTLSQNEFLRRFLLHVLPKGFVRIRNFGFLANRRRATLLPLCFHLLGSTPQAEQDLSGSKDSSDLWLCPKCGGPMQVIERLTAVEIQLRSPPALVTVAA